MNVGFISLGCSKNLVDTEIAIGIFKNKKYNIENDEKEADIIVINTCGFIESAKEEAINTILEMAEYKKKRCKALIVMGCLVERYKEDLEKAIPEVDLFIKFSEYDDICEKLEQLLEEITYSIQQDYNRLENYIDRVITTGNKTAYLRIAEGCSNRCTYCANPYIRGSLRSRKIEDILEEVRYLASKGYEELIIIAQDTTKYGIDLYNELKLAELLKEISKTDGIKWIRFLYSYPEGITDELIETVSNNKKIAKYFDIPIQHISNSILKKMNRKTSKENITNIIEKIRNKIPEVTLRTSLIVGFPGETKENFAELLEFIKTTKFDKLGTFMYSKEEGTPAARLPEQIHGNTKKSRYNKVMKVQQEISKQILENKIGKTYNVLVEEISFDGKYFVGRTMQDVPEIDGLVYIKNDQNLKVEEILNNFVECRIEKISNYDLLGEIITK